MLKPSEDNNTGTFSAVPGNLGSFMESLQVHEAPAEEVETVEIPENQDYPGINEPPIDFNEDEDQQPGNKVVPKNIGKSLAYFTDKAYAFGAGIYAHDKSERFRATDQEMEELIDAFSDFCEETDLALSPTWNLILAILAIYAFKSYDVHKIRQENLAREAAEEQEAQRKEWEAYQQLRQKQEENNQKE